MSEARSTIGTVADGNGRLIIVSNRLPLTIRVENGRAVMQQSVGGLATGLRGPHERRGGMWIGWPGDIEDLSAAERAEVDRELARWRALPVFLSKQDHAIFYEHISNAVLWPICHDRIDRIPLYVQGWDVYEEVNRRFADSVVSQWQPGDIIWVHDYHLLRVPALVRQQIPDARIGFFLHIPFPNPEVFLTLPTRSWLVEGMMGADLVGFHTRRYRGHFTAALRRLFRLEMDAQQCVSWRGRSVRLSVFPMGVDAAVIAERSASAKVAALAHEYRTGVQRLIVGVDRLDYSKGIPRRLLAVRRLLEKHPDWRGAVRLVQVAAPSRGGVGAYRELRKEVESLVGRINGKFGTPTWTPVHYIHRNVQDELLLALYRAADAFVVTPLRDGMNLVAKEFAASRTDNDGVLVLSEFAGAADELGDALIVNPYDIDGVADAIHHALTMDERERHRRMVALRARVANHDVTWWTNAFLEALASATR
jgi:trehalose 6-phosphate synthase/phosphatase